MQPSFEKKIILSLLVCISGFIVFSQQKQTELLTGKTWQLQKDAMSGMGSHVSLPPKTLLIFDSNGSWSSTEPIAGNDMGHWHIDRKGAVIMDLGNNKSAQVTLIESCCLQIVQKNRLNKNTWVWQRK